MDVFNFHFNWILYLYSPSGITSPLTVTLATTSSSTTDVLDMPVDPNEPTYCLCHQVSYGEMIGCDNTDVSVWCVIQLTRL